MNNYCKNCVHYYGGAMDICCQFCDPPFFDYYEEKEIEEAWQF